MELVYSNFVNQLLANLIYFGKKLFVRHANSKV